MIQGLAALSIPDPQINASHFANEKSTSPSPRDCPKANGPGAKHSAALKTHLAERIAYPKAWCASARATATVSGSQVCAPDPTSMFNTWCAKALATVLISTLGLELTHASWLAGLSSGKFPSSRAMR